MGFFSSLFGKKFETKNWSTPFYKNRSPLERREWFLRTTPWNRVDSKIIDALIKKFGENSKFEVFVITSMKHNLVPRYEKLNEMDESKSDRCCSLIATMLCEVGMDSARRMIALQGNFQNNKDEVRKYYSTVRNTFETATVLDENQIAAYGCLSIVLGSINKYEDGLKYARQGIAVIQEMRKGNTPFHLSDIDMSKHCGETMDEIEKTLRRLVEGFEKHLRQDTDT